MNKGAFSISLSNLLSQAKAIEAKEIEIENCMNEFFTLKHMIFIIQRLASTRIGMKHWKRTWSPSLYMISPISRALI